MMEDSEEVSQIDVPKDAALKKISQPVRKFLPVSAPEKEEERLK